MKIPVLISDDAFLVCEKPVGISSESPGLPDMVSEQSGRHVLPVHRLDRCTGGVIVLACRSDVCASLQKQFLSNQVRKEYLAVISGKPEEKKGRCEDLLFHDKKTNKTFIVNRIRSGVKHAVCEWELLESVSVGEQIFSLVLVFLHTGRTHQIRAQFSSRGFPLVGDHRYGSRVKTDSPALWSLRIRFEHPCVKGRIVHAVSVPPHVYPWNLFHSLSDGRLIRS